jgi:hypothetical protein
MAAASRDQAGLLFSQAAGFVSARRVSSSASGCSRAIEGSSACDRAAGSRCSPPTTGRATACCSRWRCSTSSTATATSALPDVAGQAAEAQRPVGRDLDGRRAGHRVRGRPRAGARDRDRASTRDGFHTRAAVARTWCCTTGRCRRRRHRGHEGGEAANPLSTITRDELAKKRRSPSMTVQHWRRFVCNQAVGRRRHGDRPVRVGGAGSEEQIPEGEPVAVGLDLGWRHDTTAIVPLWMPEPEHRQFGRRRS